MATPEEDKVVATPDVKNQLVSTDSQPSKDLANCETLSNSNVENSNSHNNDLSNSKTLANKGFPASEIQDTSGDANELNYSKQSPNNEPQNSESLPNNQLGNVAAPHNSQPVDSEAAHENLLVNSEGPPVDQLVSSEATLDRNPALEAPPSNQVVDYEALHNNGVDNSKIRNSKDEVVSETQCTDELVVSETPHSNEVVVSETQHGHEEMVVCETQHSNEVVVSETQHSNEVVDSETQHSNEVVVSETQQSNEVVISVAQHSSELVMSDTHPSNETVMDDGQISSDVVMSEAMQENELANSMTDPNNQLSHPETLPHNHQFTNLHMIPEDQLPQPESLPNSEPLPSSETLADGHLTDIKPTPYNHLPDYGILPNNHLDRSGALANHQPANSENELANSTTDPNNQLSHPETLPKNHQFTDLHMIPEYQLPEPESLPNSELTPTSEPLADNHLSDIKPIIPHNHLSEYDMLPNNHLDHSEALANHQPANSETLSHDQLANSQTLTHYELAYSETLHNNQLVNSQAHYEIVSANTLPRYEIVNAETLPNNEENTPETQPIKRRKKKSMVWEHFTIETVSPGCRRACCNRCKQSFAYSTGSKVAGTSHLKRHIAKGTCPALLHNQDPNQLTPYTPHLSGSGAGNASNTRKRRYSSHITPYKVFDQDRGRHEIARMIIMHDHPLHMVEDPGFVAFVKNLQPQFNMVTFNTVQGDCVATYLMEKQNLMKYFQRLPGRVCLTLDIWTSSQSVGYVFITGHFVDTDWKLQRRILNVVMEPYPDSDSAISHAVAVCLSDWNLEGRLFSITCNQALTEVALENLRPLLSLKNPLILNGQLLIGNCIARTLSNVANDLLSLAQGIINKIRESVKYVKTSESHEEKFLELKQQLQVPSERSLFIDDQTQWNTTYQMLVAASELKEVFSCLDTSDPDYKGRPTIQDWKLVETLCTYLKPLFDAANILTTITHPTAITFFHEVWKLELDLTRAVMNEDPFISNLTKSMQEKIDKYWRDCSLVLVIAVVMDPRFKMKLVEFSFTKIYGENADVYIKIVDDGIHELFYEYVALPLPLTPAYVEEGSAGSHMKVEGSPGGTLLSDSGLTDLDAYIMETTSQQMKSELDQYLEESLLPRVPDFDVLGWWKLNKFKYPTLSKMARDILTIPVSTVPSESVFDKKSKEMDQYRSSLRPETMEALVCAKDWMQYGAAEASNALVKMEF